MRSVLVAVMGVTQMRMGMLNLPMAGFGDGGGQLVAYQRQEQFSADGAHELRTPQAAQAADRRSAAPDHS